LITRYNGKIVIKKVNFYISKRKESEKWRVLLLSNECKRYLSLKLYLKTLT